MEKKKHQKHRRKDSEPLYKKIYSTLSRPFSVADGENTLKIKDVFAEKKNKLEEAIKKRVRFKSFYDKSES